MTNEQRNQIITLRRSGKSYTEIARELGLGKSTVSNFCLRNGVEPSKNNLIDSQFRGNTAHAGNVEKQSVLACKVSVRYADKTDEASLAEALRILANVR